MLLLGLCNFGLSYFLYYGAMEFLVSGITALIFFSPAHRQWTGEPALLAATALP